MTVYVDNAAVPYRGKPRYHLASADVAELHVFAERCGIARCWYHASAKLKHYDVTEAERNKAIASGALAVTAKELVTLIRAHQREGLAKS